MLIEASRGGHTNVANVLLRQPRDSSPLDTPSCSPMGSRNSGLDQTLPAMSAQEEGAPVDDEGSENGGGEISPPIAQEEGKGEELSEDSGGKWYTGCEGGVAKEEGETAAETGEDVTRLGKSLPKSENTLDLVDSDAASKAKRQKIADGATLPPSELLQTSHHHHHPECPLSTTGAMAATPSSPGKTGKGSHESCTLKYATDSATAMKNIQQWTSGNANALNQFSASSKDSNLGSSVDAPAPVPSDVTQESRIPERLCSADDLINDIIKGHVTAEDIVRRVSTGDEVVTRYNRPQASTRTPSERGQEGVVQAAADSQMESTQKMFDSQIESAEKVFSSGNFSKNVPLATSSTKNASSADPSGGSHDSLTTNPRAKTISAPTMVQGCTRQTAPARGPNTTTYAAPTSASASASDEQAVANMNLRRLIPHLEVLADLLQNPSSLETQYLAALSERAQMFPGSFPPDSEEVGAEAESGQWQTLPNNLESLAAIAAHFGHLESGPDAAMDLPNAFEALAAIASQNLAEDKSSLSNMDITSLFSNADFAKLLPTLAALEMQGGLGYDQQDPNLKPIPITDPGAMKRLWDDMLLVESNPVYVGEPAVGGEGMGVTLEGLVDDMAEYVEERLQGHQQAPGQSAKFFSCWYVHR